MLRNIKPYKVLERILNPDKKKKRTKENLKKTKQNQTNKQKTWASKFQILGSSLGALAATKKGIGSNSSFKSGHIRGKIRKSFP